MMALLVAAGGAGANVIAGSGLVLVSSLSRKVRHSDEALNQCAVIRYQRRCRGSPIAGAALLLTFAEARGTYRRRR
jgi:hypothetical protein